jgi:hypothetical protein
MNNIENGEMIVIVGRRFARPRNEKNDDDDNLHKTQATRRNQMKQQALTIPYFTRKLLIEASRLGLKWDYNRQISERIAEVPDLNYPVELWITHSHRHRRACEPHIRCMISLELFKSDVVFCDMPFEFFDKLPRIQIPVKHSTVSARRAAKRREAVTV